MSPFLQDLVWDGYGVAGSANAHNFKPCTYHGSPHLCFTQVNQQISYGVGEAIIVDSNYKTARDCPNGQ